MKRSTRSKKSAIREYRPHQYQGATWTQQSGMRGFPKKLGAPYWAPTTRGQVWGNVVIFLISAVLIATAVIAALAFASTVGSLSNNSVTTETLEVTGTSLFVEVNTTSLVAENITVNEIQTTSIVTETVTVGGTELSGDGIVTEELNATTIIVTETITVGDTEVSGDGIVTEELNATTIMYQQACLEDLVHTIDAEVPSTHEIQYLDSSNGLSMTLPVDLSGYVNKQFRVYSRSTGDSDHMIEIASGGASWDDYPGYPYLRIKNVDGAGVVFEVIDSTQLAVHSGSLSYRCRDLSQQTCLPIHPVAYTFARVSPVISAPSGSFLWPDSEGNPTFTGSKRSVVTQISVYPTSYPGSIFPPPDSVHFSSATGALNALSGTHVQNTTIYFEPGTYTENILIDGFTSGADFSGSGAIPNPRTVQVRGLVLQGDPRVITGATFVDCARNYQENDYSDGNGNRIFGNRANAIIPLSSTQVKVARCDTDDARVPDKQGICTDENGPQFSQAGVVAGDIAVIYDRVGGNSYYEVKVASALDNTITFDLTGSGLSDIQTVFLPNFTDPDLCGNSFGIMPNRIIEGIGVSGDDTDILPNNAPVSVLAINKPVTMVGFWVKQSGNGASDLSSNTNLTMQTVTVSDRAQLMSTVIDGRLNGVTGGVFDSVDPCAVYGHGHLTNRINDVAWTQQNSTLPGAPAIQDRYLPLTIMGFEDSGVNDQLVIYGPARAELFGVVIISVTTAIEMEGGSLALQSGAVLVGKASGQGIDADETGIVSSEDTITIIGFGQAITARSGGLAKLNSLTYFDIDECILSATGGGRIIVGSTYYPSTGSMDLFCVDSFSQGEITIDDMGGTSPQVGTILEGAGQGYSHRTYIEYAEVRVTNSGVGGDIDPRAALTEITSASAQIVTIPCSSDSFLDRLRAKSYCVRSRTAFAHSIDITSESGCPGIRFPGGTCTATFTSAAVGDGICFTVFEDALWVTHEEGTITYSAC